MDQKDRKLLYLLDKNARMKESELGKQLKISKQVVNYRIKGLVSTGIIKQFQTMLDLSKLGLQIYSQIYCRFLDCSSQKEQEIIEYLLKHPKVAYLGLVGGKYDFFIVLVSKNLNDFDKLISEVLSSYSHELRQHTISLRTFSIRLPKKYLIDKRDSIEKKSVFTNSSEVVSIDDLDKDILILLSKDARIPLLKIADNLNEPFSTIRTRVRNLEKKGVIAGYSLLLDIAPLNMLSYKLLLSVNDKSDLVYNKLKSFALSHPNISWFAKTIGGHDYEFRVVVENIEQFQSILKEIRSNYSSIVEGLESLIIFKELKEDYSVALEHIK